MRFMLRVEVTDLTATHGVLSFLRPTESADRPSFPDFPSLAGVRAVTSGALGLDMVVDLDLVGDVTGRLDIPVAGMWAYEAARIAAHVPRPGMDTDHKTLPHEAGLIEVAVHLNKGCYRGQETVARVHNLGHPPRRLVLLHLDGGADRLPAHGAPIVDADGRDVGFAGSAARHYELGPIGLGLVKRTVPTGATLLAEGIAAAQEVIVAPDAGGAVKVTLRRDSVPQPPAAARKLI
jgi:folate-binding protein YgfZ